MKKTSVLRGGLCAGIMIKIRVFFVSHFYVSCLPTTLLPALLPAFLLVKMNRSFPDDILPLEDIYEPRAALLAVIQAWARLRSYAFLTGKSSNTPVSALDLKVTQRYDRVTPCPCSMPGEKDAVACCIRSGKAAGDRTLWPSLGAHVTLT